MKETLKPPGSDSQIQDLGDLNKTTSKTSVHGLHRALTSFQLPTQLVKTSIQGYNKINGYRLFKNILQSQKILCLFQIPKIVFFPFILLLFKNHIAFLFC